MIRCENCGHKLRDGQKICDICKKPVRRQSTEDVELEEELAKSIARIVENETADAQVYLKQIQGTLDKNGQRMEDSPQGGRTRPSQSRSSEGRDVLGVSQRSSGTRNASNTSGAGRASVSGTQQRRSASASPNRPSSGSQAAKRPSGRSEGYPSAGSYNKKKKGRGGKIALIVISSIIAVCIIIGLAFYTINMVFSKAQDNFAYYNNIGIEHIQKGEYSQAIPYLEKALTYEESNGKVNVRFSLYDCYAATGDTEKAISMLYNILNIEPYNLEAIVNLETYYENAGVTDALKELYEKYKDTAASVAVEKYYVEAPKLSVEGGKYATDMGILISSDYGFEIYYTTDGTEPTAASRKYAGEITVKEGTTVLKCIAVNAYNIASEVVSAEYVIAYEAPAPATISPASGSYETEQLIVIGNIPIGGEAYYTLDNTIPNKNSTLYEGPFDMPLGNIILSVIVYDKNGLASRVVKRNYVLNRADRVSQEEALNQLWDTMQVKNMVDANHLSSEGEPVNLVFDAKRTIDGCSIWVFSIIVSTEQGDMKANYQMGVDSETSYVYTVYENNGIYRLDPVQY